MIGDVFINYGIINFICWDVVIIFGFGLVVGMNFVVVIFINISNNLFNIFVGSGGSGVSIYVYGMGVLSNFGMIDVFGGSIIFNIFN